MQKILRLNFFSALRFFALFYAIIGVYNALKSVFQGAPTIDFLIGFIEAGTRDASAAHEALCRSAPSNAVLERLKQLGKPC